jgi:hypothetical protein
MAMEEKDVFAMITDFEKQLFDMGAKIDGPMGRFMQIIRKMATDIEILKAKTAIPVFSGLPMCSFSGVLMPRQPCETSPHEVSLEVIGKKPVRVNLNKPENDIINYLVSTGIPENEAAEISAELDGLTRGGV